MKIIPAHKQLMGLIGMGVGTVIIGMAPETAFFPALVAMGVVGCMNSITNGPAFAILQAKVAPEMQGRVFTVVGSACAVMAPLGMSIAGPVADSIGVQSWYVIGGSVTILLGITALFIPALSEKS